MDLLQPSNLRLKRLLSHVLSMCLLLSAELGCQLMYTLQFERALSISVQTKVCISSIGQPRPWASLSRRRAGTQKQGGTEDGGVALGTVVLAPSGVAGYTRCGKQAVQHPVQKPVLCRLSALAVLPPCLPVGNPPTDILSPTHRWISCQCNVPTIFISTHVQKL